MLLRCRGTAARELDGVAALAGRVLSPGGEGRNGYAGQREDVNGGGLEKTRTDVLVTG
jgi:hypothetical protein